MRSKIFMADEIVNAERKLGSALSYVAVEVILLDGHKSIALFTPAEIAHGCARGESNPEDRERVEAILQLRAERMARERAAARMRLWAWGGVLVLAASAATLMVTGILLWP